MPGRLASSVCGWPSRFTPSALPRVRCARQAGRRAGRGSPRRVSEARSRRSESSARAWRRRVARSVALALGGAAGRRTVRTGRRPGVVCPVEEVAPPQAFPIRLHRWMNRDGINEPRVERRLRSHAVLRSCARLPARGTQSAPNCRPSSAFTDQSQPLPSRCPSSRTSLGSRSPAGVRSRY